MSAWIDFRELRANLDFEEVLRHYGVEVKRRGEQHHGFCPLPGHEGKRNSPSFSANLARGIFQCFGCKAKGNILDFAALMEQVDPHNSAAFRDVALRLGEKFCVGSSVGRKIQETAKPATKEKRAAASTASESPALINPPLDFELKGLDPGHPYLANRGFSLETITRFGLGFCSRGSLKGRIAIPLHDQKGKLIGYAGRIVDDKTVNDENPKYRFPSKRQRDGKVFEFRKSRFLYNGFRIGAPVDDLIVVEGFASVWWVDQNGFKNSVATMGSDCSDRQAELIVASVNPGGRVWILSDGDAAGELQAQSLLVQVSPHRFVRRTKLGTDCQPTDLSSEQLSGFLTL